MSDKKLMREINRERHRQPLAFWGLWIAIVSLLYGEFIVRVDGYLLRHKEPYFADLPEDLIGGLLLVAGVLKLIGVLANQNTLKKVGIVTLSALWSGLFVLAFTYSFGTGYPHPSYIFMGFVVIACFRISLKGDFGK